MVNKKIGEHQLGLDIPSVGAVNMYIIISPCKSLILETVIQTEVRLRSRFRTY